MWKLTEKWAYVWCIVCNARKYFPIKKFNKLTNNQKEADNFAATFKCNKCKEIEAKKAKKSLNEDNPEE